MDDSEETRLRKYFSRKLRSYRDKRCLYLSANDPCHVSEEASNSHPPFRGNTLQFPAPVGNLRNPSKREFPGARQSDCMSPGKFPVFCIDSTTSHFPEKLEQTGEVPEQSVIWRGQWDDKWRRRTLGTETTFLDSDRTNGDRYGMENAVGKLEKARNSVNGIRNGCRCVNEYCERIDRMRRPNRYETNVSARLDLCRCTGPKSRPDCTNPELCIGRASLQLRSNPIDGAMYTDDEVGNVGNLHFPYNSGSERKTGNYQKANGLETKIHSPVKSSWKLTKKELLLRQREENRIVCPLREDRRREKEERGDDKNKRRCPKWQQEIENNKIEQDSALEEDQENQTNIIIMGVGTANSSAQSVHQSDLSDIKDISSNETCVLSQSNTHLEMCKTAKEDPSPLRIIHERTSSHCEITPECRTSSEDDVSQDIYNRRRPWSHIYGDVEAERIFNPPSIRDTAPSFWRRMSISGGSQPTLIAEEPPPSREVPSGLLSRYFTLRTSTPQLSSVDSVLERFRKSFNFRFQKSKNKQTDVSSSDISRNQEYITPCNSHQDYICRDLSTSTCSKKSPKKSSANKENVKVGFRIGSLILRSSREGKKNKKLNEEFNGKMDDTDNKNKINPTVYQNCHSILKEELSTNIIEENDLTEDVENLTEANSVLSHSNDINIKKDVKQNYGMEQSLMLLTPHNTPTTEQVSFPSPINLCALHLQLLLHHYRGIARLRRSISQPIALETLGSTYKQGTILCGPSEQDSQEVSLSSSEEEISSDSELYHSQRSCSWRSGSSCGEYDSEPVDGDVMWDHNATDSEEFDFKATDRIKITDPSVYRDWWWGSGSNKSGWLSAAYIRLSANKESSDKESHSRPLLHNLPGKFSNDQIRASVVQEIITTEQDFVKHLKDVVEGYLRQVRRRPDMFTEDCISTIFGNIESIYNFQSQFLKHLQSCFDADKPHMSDIGNCFLEHKQQFKMYSEYCNNHPLAVSKLQELYADPKYLHFFEACRLLQEMIDISLDGFLLTPIQRICKYPLQLAELLKYTSSDHNDYKAVTDAFAAMQEVAHMVNERKRRMECLEQLAELQQNIEGWEGPELLDTSTMLIHSGDVTRVSSSWSRDIYVFLFDNLLVYCKKDLLKRNTYIYKGRLNLNSCQLVEIEDGRDVHFNMNARNAWKLYCSPRKKWFLFYTKTAAEKSKWINAFKEERKIVKEDESQGFAVTQQDKKIARAAVINKIKPRRSRVKVYKKNAYPDISPLHLSAAGRTGSLPSNFQPDFVSLSGRTRKSRKKESSWFHFGSGKKRKK